MTGARPYPWPYDGPVRPGELALLVVATRPPPGRLPGNGAATEGALPDVVADLAGAISRVGGRVLVVGPAVPAGSAAAPAHDLLPEAALVPAAGLDGFHGGPLDLVLRSDRRTQLVLTGLGLEAGVHSTMRSANDRGYECLLLPDACRSLRPDLAGPAAAMVTMSGGIFGAVASAAELLDALDTLARSLQEAP